MFASDYAKFHPHLKQSPLPLIDCSKEMIEEIFTWLETSGYRKKPTGGRQAGDLASLSACIAMRESSGRRLAALDPAYCNSGAPGEFINGEDLRSMVVVYVYSEFIDKESWTSTGSIIAPSLHTRFRDSSGQDLCQSIN